MPGFQLLVTAVLGTFAVAGRLEVKHAFGLNDDFTSRCSLDSTVTEGKFAVDPNAGSLSSQQLSALLKAVDADDMYRISIGSSASSYAASVSVKACALVSAALTHNVRIMTDSAGALSSIDVQLAQPKGFHGCRGRQGIPADRLRVVEEKIATGQAFPFTTHFVPMPVVDTPPLPSIAAAKGSAYPGQKEFSDADVAAIFGSRAGVGGAGGGPGQAGVEGQGKGGKVVDPEAALEAKKEEEPKSFLQRNWHLLVIGGMWLAMRLQGEEKPAERERGAQQQGATQRQAAGGKPAEQAKPGDTGNARARLQAALAAKQQQ